MPKILKNVRLTEQQIKTVDSTKGKDFTDKLCSMIDKYDYSSLEAKRLIITSRITILKSKHTRIKIALVKALEKIDSLIEEIKNL